MGKNGILAVIYLGDQSGLPQASLDFRVYGRYRNICPFAFLCKFEFLKRRNDILNKGIEYFFRYYYPDVIERFYSDVPTGQLEIAITETIQDWIREGNPIPVLPEYLHDLLI